MVKKFKAGLPSEVLPSMIDAYDIINSDRIIEKLYIDVTSARSLLDKKVLVRKRIRRTYTVDDMIADLTRISKKGKDIPVYMMNTSQPKIRTVPGKVLYDDKTAAVTICDWCEYSDAFEVSMEDYHTNAVKCTALEIIEKHKLIKLIQKATNSQACLMVDDSLISMVASEPTRRLMDPSNEVLDQILTYLNEALEDGPDTNQFKVTANSIKLIKNGKGKLIFVFSYTVKKLSDKESKK